MPNLKSIKSSLLTETVTRVHHWTDTLFSFSTTRDSSFRFENGHFTMIGLPIDGRPLLRAYSIASANHEQELEFFSIKVADGALTSQLQRIQPGDQLLVGRKPTGTLVADHLLAGRNLYLLATGTGLAPFISIIKDPEIYQRFDNIVLAHGVRTVAELAYRELIEQSLPQHEYLGEMVSRQLHYYPTVTRESFRTQGRLSDAIATQRLPQLLGLNRFDVEHDRFMLCGSPSMLAECTAILAGMGFSESRNGYLGHFVIERAFVER